MDGHLQPRIDAIFREERGRVLANLVRSIRDFELAEDALQEAVVAALHAWRKPDAFPEHPGRWLYHVARRKMIDVIRRRESFRHKTADIVISLQNNHDDAENVWQNADEIPDERLRLMFTCCHPALSADAQIALTLQTLGGLKTPEIARAFLLPETTMAQRLVRAKRKIKVARIPYQVPHADQLGERLDGVLSTLYLIFNEGYLTTHHSHPLRTELCDEAIRLARILVRLVPDHAEAKGLLALLVLHHARSPARLDAEGHLVTLEDQDRSRWNAALISQGTLILEEALVGQTPGPFQLQAAISALHSTAPDHASTDWPQIHLLYQRLHDLQPSPVVQLNAIVALSFAQGPAVALRALASLQQEPTLQAYLPLHATAADLHRRMNHPDAAKAAYRRALALADNEAQRQFFTRRIQAFNPKMSFR